MTTEKTSSPHDDMLKVGQVAKMLGVTTMTIYRLVKRGDMPAVMIGQRCFRFKREDVMLYIQNRTTSGVNHGK